MLKNNEREFLVTLNICSIIIICFLAYIIYKQHMQIETLIDDKNFLLSRSAIDDTYFMGEIKKLKGTVKELTNNYWECRRELTIYYECCQEAKKEK
jgi:septation ring formation regulator EzrA